jgi:hypothetical protein
LRDYVLEQVEAVACDYNKEDYSDVNEVISGPENPAFGHVIGLDHFETFTVAKRNS